MRDTAVSSTPRRRRSLRRAFTAFAAVPTALALGSGLFAAAPATAVDVTNQAQNSLFGSSDVTDYLETDGVPQRTPIRTDEHPSIQGLPSGVSVERVEWITERRIALFIRSAAMPKELIQVQVLLARDWHSNPSAKYPEVWALDGLRALDTESGWTINTNIEQFYADKNVNVILPVGGESSFYSDWQKPDNGKHYKWETFMTKELPAVLQNGYRSNGERAVFGLSMGGTAAINLAERNPDMFKFVGSFSGYLDTTSMGMAQAISAAQSDAGGYNSEAMWGQPGSQDWIDHDPKLGIDALKGKAVYVSSGSGADDFGQPGSVANGPANPAGVGLEILSRMTTQTFVDRAKKSNVDVTAVFRPSGVHNWPYWQFEMTQAWPYIADSLKLAQADRGADCATQGAIAEVTKSNAFGACVNNEYDVKGGKAQDFRGGRAYWSPETGAHVLFGRIGARYSEFGGPDSWLGHPTSGEKATRMARDVTFTSRTAPFTGPRRPVPVLCRRTFSTPGAPRAGKAVAWATRRKTRLSTTETTFRSSRAATSSGPRTKVPTLFMAKLPRSTPRSMVWNPASVRPLAVSRPFLVALSKPSSMVPSTGAQAPAHTSS